MTSSDEDAGSAAVAMPVRSSIGRNASVLLGSQIVTWAFALIVISLQPRLLGPVNVGHLRVAIALWMIADAFINLGTNQIIVTELAQDHRRGAVVGRVVALQLLLYAASTVVLSVLVLLLGYEGQLILIIALQGITSFLNIFAASGRAAFHGLERMSTPAFADILARVITVPVLIAVLFLTGSAVAVVLVMAGNMALAAGITVFKLRRIPGISYRPTLLGIRDLVRRSVPFFTIDSSRVLYHQIDAVLISLLVTEAAVGWYSSADTLVGSLIFIPSAFVISVFPVMTRLFHEGNSGELLELVRKSFGFLLFVGMPVGVGIAIVSRQVVLILFGSEFAESGPVLALFGITIVLLYPSMAIGIYAIATGRVRFYGLLILAMTALTVPLDLLLVPWTDRQFENGAIGGALSYIITNSIILVTGVCVLLPKGIARAVRGRVARVVLATTAMAAVAWALRDVFIAVPVIAGAGVYAVVAMVLGAVDRSEMDAARRVVERISTKLRLGRA